MKTSTNAATLLAFMAAAMSLNVATALLVQPYNYMLDDSAMVGQHDQSGSLSPFYNDQQGASEQNADKDIVSIIGDGLARLRFARMMDGQDDSAQQQGHFSQEMAELIQNEQQNQQETKPDNSQEPSLSSSVANMLMNVAQAAAQASAPAQAQSSQESSHAGSSNGDVAMSSRGSIMELDTSAPSSASAASSLPSKADLKSERPIQWFNPKETIPVLKISSMATPSKYKKVYFRSEKKLVDGAFHSPTSEHDEKKSLMKTFNSGVQRRSSRGTSSSVAPPSILQDGVIDFLKKFRDVYIQTRPVNTASAASSASNLASSMVSAAASSPFASILAPSSSSGSRPNLASALSAATSMIGQAAAASSGSSSPSSSAAGAASSAAGSAAGASSPIKSPLTAQSYVSFWSKTFPTWVRKMLKQLRRRSLYNSSKRHQAQHHHHHSATSAIGQAAQAAAASVVESASSGSSGSGSGSGSSSSSSH